MDIFQIDFLNRFQNNNNSTLLLIIRIVYLYCLLCRVELRVVLTFSNMIWRERNLLLVLLFSGELLILISLCMNANIKKTQIYHKFKHDLKGH